MELSKLTPIGLIILLGACAVPETNLPEPEPEPEPYNCLQSECWDSQFYVCRDSHYIDYFTRISEWTGADATYSVELDESRRIWLFGDTFIDQVNTDGSRPSFNLINNSVVLEEGDQFTTFYSGSRTTPESFLSPPEDNWWYWPADGTVQNDTLYLFMHGFANDTGGAWDFYRTCIDLIKLNPMNLQVYENIRLTDSPGISWGAAILEDNSYTYIYGAKSTDFSKHAYVARAESGLSADWEYFNGTDWSDDEAEAAVVFNDVSEQFSVFKQDGSYYLLSQNNLFGYEIFLSNISGPTGAIVDKQVIYCTPESTGDIFTYNALAHPQVYQDSLLVSYNVNSFDFTDLLEDVNNYRPYFIRVGNWQNQ